MKTIKNLKLLIFNLFITLFISSCVNDDSIVVNPTPISELTLTEVIVSSPNVSIFLEALLRTNLDGTFNSSETYTLFVPNNAAFERFFDEVNVTGLSAFSNEELADLVLNHVLDTEELTTDFSTGYINTLSVGADSNEISLYINTDGNIELNSRASLIENDFDVETSNGIIHVIDEVINVPSVYNHIEINPNFSTFLSALSRTTFSTDFTDLLQGATDSPFTVFVPTNAAFESLLSDLEVDSLDDIDDTTLENIINHHISSEINITSSTFTDAQIISTLSEVDLEVDFNDGIKLIDGSGESSGIILTDIQSGNGILHGIDRVLLPEEL